MKKLSYVITVLLLTGVLFGFTACGGGNEAADDISGNWYVPTEQGLTTLRLEGNGNGRLGADDLTYEYEGDTLSVDVEGSRSMTLEKTSDDEYGEVLKDGANLYAIRDKDKAKDYMAAHGPDATSDSDTDKDTDTDADKDADADTDSDAKTGGSGSDAKTDGASGNQAKDASAFIGTWDGLTATTQGVTLELSELEMTFQVDINEDGTMSATTNGESDGSGKWTYADNALHVTDPTGGAFTCTIDGDGIMTFVFEDEDMTFTLKKR